MGDKIERKPRAARTNGEKSTSALNGDSIRQSGTKINDPAIYELAVAAAGERFAKAIRL